MTHAANYFCAAVAVVAVSFIERINIMDRLLLAAGLAALTLGVAACGGDGSHNSPSGPSNTPPPARAVITNMHSDLDYEVLRQSLPPNIVPAHDGMRLSLD